MPSGAGYLIHSVCHFDGRLERCLCSEQVSFHGSDGDVHDTGNLKRIQNRSGFYKVPRRIVAPNGSEDPFYYSIETHYGSSDHMVFNNWGVQVPGIMNYLEVLKLAGLVEF